MELELKRAASHGVSRRGGAAGSGSGAAQGVTCSSAVGPVRVRLAVDYFSSPEQTEQGSMEELEPEEQFLRFARNGDLPGIQRLLMSTIREETHININCREKG
ncbi:hypothetical protein EYF80_047665 [Liparis tanakae]|uniref:Uncharacterized protein n=1 Tax=Liparis tanakae TaxID=230148 RepID=A0A4Z2FMC7_9TELE|nr:hypothetical protein EYF80_047665 [Liparis tanakae]